jgi:hypothetical protein
MVLPFARGEGGANVEAVILKMHDPNAVVPVAVLPPALIENAGLASVLVNITVVAVPVVPKSLTPFA